MKTRLTLTIEIDHSHDYDPVNHFVYYFSDDEPEPDYIVVSEEWEDVPNV